MFKNVNILYIVRVFIIKYYMKYSLLFFFSIFYSTLFSQTNCTSLPLPFTENFEEDSPTLSCWTALNQDNNTTTWITNNGFANSGSQCKAILLQNAMYFSTANDYLVSPQINLGNDGVVKQLKFYVKLSPLEHANWRVAQKLRVSISTNNGISANDFLIDVLPNRYYTNGYYQMVLVDLVNAQDVPLQGNVRVGFHVFENVNPIGRGIYIDDVSITNKPTCAEHLDVTVCANTDNAVVSFNNLNANSQYEYSLQYAGQEPIFPGVANQSSTLELNNLLPNTDYVLYVRNVCNGTFSNYVPFYFKTIVGVSLANPFCGESGSLVFENNYGQPDTSGYGPIGCLSFSPNPIWYYFEVSQSGNLEFNIIQNTQFNAAGQPIGQNLDVDYVAFGPFDSLEQACHQIEATYCLDCPSYQQVVNPGAVPANSYPNGNIVDCSPSPSYIEELSIANAIEGQFYAVLISNWDGLQGYIKLEQTNINEPGAGSTNCDFLCTVDVGDDIVVCNETSYTITADVNTQGTGDILSIQWFRDGVLLNPATYNTLSINVTTDGIYRVEIVKDQCEQDMIEDEIWVRFVSSFPLNSIPNHYNICDVNNDLIQLVDFNAYEATFINQNYTATYYITENDANLGSNYINRNNYSISNSTTLYVRISHVLNNNCYVVKPVQFILNSMDIPTVEFTYPSEVCMNDVDVVFPRFNAGFVTGGRFSSTSGLEINSQTGEINISSSLQGTYIVKYHLPMDVANCVAEGNYEFTVKLFPKFTFDIYAACVNEDFSLGVKNLVGINFSDIVSYLWSGPRNFTSTNEEIYITDEGTYHIQITTKDGCVLKQSIIVDNTKCFIQKGISPNGDGLNESFIIENYIIVQLKIINRYGNEVFVFKGDYKDEWHGQDKSGNELPSGTYFYEIITHKGPITGWIEINR